MRRTPKELEVLFAELNFSPLHLLCHSFLIFQVSMIAAFIFLGLLKGEHCFCETHYKKFNIYIYPLLTFIYNINFILSSIYPLFNLRIGTNTSLQVRSPTLCNDMPSTKVDLQFKDPSVKLYLLGQMHLQFSKTRFGVSHLVSPWFKQRCLHWTDVSITKWLLFCICSLL